MNFCAAISFSCGVAGGAESKVVAKPKGAIEIKRNAAKPGMMAAAKFLLTITTDGSTQLYAVPPFHSRISPTSVEGSTLSHYVRYFTTFQDESGLNVWMAFAAAAVFAPKSFSRTIPAWLTMNVLIPEPPYSAGHAISPK